MYLVTMDNVPGCEIVEVLGVVSGENFQGVNFVKDAFAALTDVFGGSSNTYAAEMVKARQNAMSTMETRARELGANAVVSIDLDFELISLGQQKSAMMFASCNGTAVRIVRETATGHMPSPSVNTTRDKARNNVVHPSHFEDY